MKRELLYLYDVGARGGVGEEWSFCSDRLSVVMFEPDEDECQRMSNRSHKYFDRKILPYALGDASGLASFYVTQNGQCSSLLRPNLKLLRERYRGFSKHFEIKDIAQVSLRSMDDVVVAQGIAPPDVIKIDVQGAEKLILDGACSCLETVKAVRIESHLRDVYIGETLFGDMINYFHSKGFELRKIINDKTSRFLGEILEVDAIFMRSNFLIQCRNVNFQERWKLDLIQEAWKL